MARASPEDFVVVKVDIDTPAAELTIMEAIADRPEIAALVGRTFQARMREQLRLLAPEHCGVVLGANEAEWSEMSKIDSSMRAMPDTPRGTLDHETMQLNYTDCARLLLRPVSVCEPSS